MLTKAMAAQLLGDTVYTCDGQELMESLIRPEIREALLQILHQSDEVNGWKPPIIYDYATDKARIATQADIDALQHQVQTLAQMLGSVESAVNDCRARVKWKPEPKG